MSYSGFNPLILRENKHKDRSSPSVINTTQVRFQVLLNSREKDREMGDDDDGYLSTVCWILSKLKSQKSLEYSYNNTI